MERELTFRIVLEKPPAGVDFALQKGKGNSYETIQRQRSGAQDLRFEFTARAAARRQRCGSELARALRSGPLQRTICLPRYRRRRRSNRLKLEQTPQGSTHRHHG